MTVSINTIGQDRKNSSQNQSVFKKLFSFFESSTLFNAVADRETVETENEELSLADTEIKSEKSKKKAPVIGILGAKGGVGATTLAINLASSLSRKYSEALLIDTNLQQPDVALSLGLKPSYSLSDLIARRNRIDEKVLEACCEELEEDNCSLKIVSPPLELEKSLVTDLSLLSECMGKLKSLNDIVVLDLPKQLDQGLLTILDSCDKLILVCEPTISSVTTAKRWLSIFSDLEYSKEDVCLLINKSGKRQKQIEKEAIQALDFNTNWQLPISVNNLEQSTLAGEPLVISQPRDPYSKAINNIADEIRHWFTLEVS